MLNALKFNLRLLRAVVISAAGGQWFFFKKGQENEIAENFVWKLMHWLSHYASILCKKYSDKVYALFKCHTIQSLSLCILSFDNK